MWCAMASLSPPDPRSLAPLRSNRLCTRQGLARGLCKRLLHRSHQDTYPPLPACVLPRMADAGSKSMLRHAGCPPDAAPLATPAPGRHSASVV